MRALPRSALLLLLLTACAHVLGKGGSVDDAQRTATAYLRVLRWQGTRDSAAFVAPEQREVYLGRIERDKLEQGLKVTEFELREVERSPDATQATARADVSWYVEPEVTLKKETLVLHLGWRGSAWLIESIDGGPLPLPALPHGGASQPGAAPAAAPAAEPDAGAPGA